MRITGAIVSKPIQISAKNKNNSRIAERLEPIPLAPAIKKKKAILWSGSNKTTAKCSERSKNTARTCWIPARN